MIDDVIKEFNSNKIELISSIPNMNTEIYNSCNHFLINNFLYIFTRIFKQILMNFQNMEIAVLFIVIGKNVYNKQ